MSQQTLCAGKKGAGGRGGSGDVIPVPVLSDNYAYLIVDRSTGKAACVDPAEPDKVISAATKAGVEIVLGLCTHKHSDHSGGNARLTQLLPGVEVAGPDEAPGVTLILNDRQDVKFGNMNVRALKTACHTQGSLTYLVTPSDEYNDEFCPWLFTGDTLFVGGCGRFFEGDAEDMRHSLLDVIGTQRQDSLIYCGHEYTVANLKFALHLEPHNAAVKAKYDWACKQREAHKPTVPSILQEEFLYNPFMRVNQTEFQRLMSKLGAAQDAVAVMQSVRQIKNNFRG
eukprot:GHVQ01018313.1.p1 GENE.GHVQ01018313.1~~GHVQ01018313.1.p1  ORF type:complete len:283 (+),score=27.61 GHVQ01018313.1:172-1020(+)